MSGKFCPEGTVPAQGQVLETQQHPGLFYVLGAQYGGNGKTTFALPNLAGPAGTRYCLVVAGDYPTNLNLRSGF